MTINNNQNGTFTIEATEDDVILMHTASETLLLNLSLCRHPVDTDLARKVIEHNETLQPIVIAIEEAAYQTVEKP